MTNNFFIETFLGDVFQSDLIPQGIEFFHASNETWDVGDVLEIRNFENRRHYQSFFQRRLNLDHFPDRSFVRKRRIVENIYENVRRGLFPDRPSRAVSIFANWCLGDAQTWTNRNQNVPRTRIYQLEFVSQGNFSVHSLYWFNLSIQALTRNGINRVDKLILIKAQAENYWRGSRGPHGSNYEILINGNSRVIRRFDSNGQPIP